MAISMTEVCHWEAAVAISFNFELLRTSTKGRTDVSPPWNPHHSRCVIAKGSVSCPVAISHGVTNTAKRGS